MGLRTIARRSAVGSTSDSLSKAVGGSKAKGRGRLSAATRLRCPECRSGILYAAPNSMNRRCPKCGIRFEREPGYFTGSIWIGVILATPVALGLLCGTMWAFPDLHPAIAGFVAVMFFSPLLPLTVRVSRSLWMYFDHQMQPQPPSKQGGDGGTRVGHVTPEGDGGGRGEIITSTGESLSSIQARAKGTGVAADSTP